MWDMTNTYRIFPTTKWASILILLIISGCAQQEETHEHDDNLSGIWEYHSIYADPITNEFVESHVHVKLTDDGNNVFIDHCLHDKAMSFSRVENLLTNGNGQSLEIIHDDKISSVSVPKLHHLVKSDASHDLENAGSIQLQSNQLPAIDLTNSVCAQRTHREEDETIILHISVPFKATYLDMTLEITQDDANVNNLHSATFSSPEFMDYYGGIEVDALYGQVNFSTLTDNHAIFDFDITLAQFGRFPGDQLTGSANVIF